MDESSSLGVRVWEIVEGREGIGGAEAESRAASTEGNSDMGRSSLGGRALKLGSLRLALISAAWRAQRQRAAITSSTGAAAFVIGEDGSRRIVGDFGEGEWRSVIFSW